MIYLTVILLLNIIFYYKILSFDYVSDDCLVKKNKPKGLIKQFWYQLVGKSYFNSKIAHLYSLIIHTTNCVLIYYAFGNNQFSFLVALLFSINPANLEGAIWLSAKGYALGTMGTLLLLVTKYFGFIPYILFSVFGFNSILAPALLFNKPYWWIALFIPIFYLLVIKRYKYIFKNLDNIKSVSPIMSSFNISRIVFSIRVLFYYFLFCLFPRRLGLYHDFNYAFGLTDKDVKVGIKIDKYFLGGISLISVVLYNFIFNYWNMPMYAFGLFWFVLFTFQWSNILPMFQQPVAQRYIYLSNIGVQIFIISCINSIPDYSIRITLFTAVFVYYITRSNLHINSYKNYKLFLDYNIYDINFPNHYFAWTVKAERELREDKSISKALDSLFEGLITRPFDIRIHFNLAKLLCIVRDFNGANWHFNQAIYHCRSHYGNDLIASSMKDSNDVAQLKKIIEEGLKQKEDNKINANVN